jgi:hypothetical protein
LSTLTFTSTDFKSHFDSKIFSFQHNLVDSELFSIGKLQGLAKQVAANQAKKFPGFFFFQKKSISWKSPEINALLENALADLPNSGCRLKLTAINTYPEYSDMFAGCVSELTRLAREGGIDFHRDYTPFGATIFIASPGETTPYHMDEEVNFLLQIAGEKVTRVYPDSVVSYEDREGYYRGKRIEYREENPYSAIQLAPGVGVYQPPFHPHLVSAGEQCSISLSLGFLKLNFPTANVSRFNGFTRSRLGVALPQVFDPLKNMAVRQALKMRRFA